MKLVTIESAAAMMQVPAQWINGMIEKGEIDAFDSPTGPLIDAEVIDTNGWNACDVQDAVSYGHVNSLMVNLGLRTLH